MPLKGDLSTIGLADVFQMLSMSQKVGTLVVQDGESRKCIYFSRQGISLLSSGQRKGVRIGDILVRNGKLSREDLERALALQKSSGKLLGEVLVEQRFVAREEIDRCMRAKVEDEICDLFTWRNATFEFIEGDPPAEFRDPMQSVTSMTMDVNSLLLEALRRVDEWKVISVHIPNADVVFSVDVMERAEFLRTPGDDLRKAIIKEVDGIGNVRDIADRLAISVFDACRLLLDFVNMKLIHRTSPQEMARRAKDLREKGDQEKALALVERASALENNSAEIAVAHAEILEAGGNAPEAARRYEQAASIARQSGDESNASAWYRLALERDPGSGIARYALFQIHASRGDADESCRLARDLVGALWKKGDDDTIKTVCAKAMTFNATNPLFPAVLVAVHRRRGEYRESDKMLKACRQIVASQREKIGQLLNEITTVLEDGGETAGAIGVTLQKKKRHPARIAALLLVVALLAGGGYVVKMETDNRDLAKNALDAARAYETGGNGAEGLALIEQAREHSRKLFVAWEEGSEEAIALVESKIRKRIEEETAKKNPPKPLAKDRDEIAAMLSKAAVVHASGDLRQARDLSGRVLQRATASGLADLQTAAQRIIDEIDAYRKSADEAYRRAQQMEKEGKIAAAVQAMIEIERRYPHSDQAMKIYYPIRIATKPPGARLYYNNIDSGTTPAVIHLSADREESVKIDRRGYEPVSAVIEEKTVGEMFFELKKTYRWRTPVEGAVRSSPVESGGVLYVASREKIIALQTEGGKFLWSHASGGDVESDLLVYGKSIIVGSNDGVLKAVRDGNEIWKITTGGMIRSGPVLLADGSTIVVGSGDGRMYAVDARMGKVQWSVDLPAHPVGRPLAAGNRILTGLADGSFVAVETGGSHRILWSVKTQGTVSGSVTAGDAVVFGATDRKVYAVSVRDGKGLWTTDLGGEISGVPDYDKNTIAVPCRDTFVYLLNSASGAVEKRLKTGGEIRATPLLLGGKLLTGSDDGSMYCFDVSEGSLLWKYDIGHPIRTSPLAGGQVIYVGSDGASVYAIDLD